MAEVARKAGRREERAVMALSSFMFEMDPNAFLERKEKVGFFFERRIGIFQNTPLLSKFYFLKHQILVFYKKCTF